MNMHPPEKPLTDAERVILSREPPGLREYHAGIFADLRRTLVVTPVSGLDVVDLSDVFSGSEGEIFVDAHHNGDTGNRILADALFTALRPLL